MAEFTLKMQEPKTLKLNIGDDSYQVPLAGSLSRKELLEIETPEGTYAFFLKYIPKKVLENIPLDGYNQIVNVWREESQKASRLTPGES